MLAYITKYYEFNEMRHMYKNIYNILYRKCYSFVSYIYICKYIYININKNIYLHIYILQVIRSTWNMYVFLLRNCFDLFRNSKVVSLILLVVKNMEKHSLKTSKYYQQRFTSLMLECIKHVLIKIYLWQFF